MGSVRCEGGELGVRYMRCEGSEQKCALGSRTVVGVSGWSVRGLVHCAAGQGELLLPGESGGTP